MTATGWMLGSAVRMAVLGTIVFPGVAVAQHQHRASTTVDTLASAPTTPRRPAADSARVADSLLNVCRPHARHSLGAYSECIGAGISLLSSAGNIALALGTLDYVISRESSLAPLSHPLAHALGYAVSRPPERRHCCSPNAMIAISRAVTTGFCSATLPRALELR